MYKFQGIFKVISSIIMSNLNVLLTGASGMVGKKILEELISRESFSIRLFLRDSKKNRKLVRSYHNKVEVVWGNLENPEEVFKAVDDQDIVIHVAAQQPSNIKYEEKKVHLINVVGTENILNAMKEQKKRPCIIYTSSIAVYGDRLNNLYIKVSDPLFFSDKDPYAKSKINAERLIQEAGFDYLIFRLSYCSSTEMLRFQPLMFDMPLNTHVEIIDTRDIALAIVNSIQLKQIWNKIYNLGGGARCQIKFREHFNDLVEIMGFGRNFLPEEAFAKEGFHCGLYDTAQIQSLLRFQEHTLQDFYNDARKWIGFKRYLVPLIKPFIRWYLLKKSRYYKEYKKNVHKT